MNIEDGAKWKRARLELTRIELKLDYLQAALAAWYLAYSSSEFAGRSTHNV